VTRLAIEVIKTRRLALDLTQQEAADQAGITREEWNGLENGRRGIGPKNAARFVDVLGGTIEDYLASPVRAELDDLRREITDLQRRVGELEARQDIT
jgi:transcriptional regulator with XRE-family HTH domain